MKFQCNDHTIRQVSATQRFVYRCIDMFGPGKMKRSNRAKQEIMDHWAKKLFDFCDARGGYYELRMEDSIVTLKINSGLCTPYQEVTIDLNEPEHSIFDMTYEYTHYPDEP